MTLWESFVVDEHNSSMGGQRNQILLASFFQAKTLPYRKFMGGLSLCITPIKPQIFDGYLWWWKTSIFRGGKNPSNLDFLSIKLWIFDAFSAVQFQVLGTCASGNPWKSKRSKWGLSDYRHYVVPFLSKKSLEIVDSTKTSQRYEAWVWEVSTADFDSQATYHSWKLHRVLIPCRQTKVGRVGSKKKLWSFVNNLFQLVFFDVAISPEFYLTRSVFLEKCRTKIQDDSEWKTLKLQT